MALKFKVTAQRLAHFHLVATIIWTLLVIPSVLWWKESIAWVVLMSVWANLASHFAAWQAARGEVKVEQTNGDNG